MKSKPFFSIITCTYNSGKYLSKNIKSVTKQTFKDYEHIFIDGFSKDMTLLIIEKYIRTDKNKIKLYNRKPSGISDAMNEGIKHAKGQYILVLHSDDRLHDNNVFKNIRSYLVRNPDLDWIYGKISVIDEDGKKIGDFPSRKIYKFFPGFFLKYYNVIPHQAVFIKKNIFKEHGLFDKTLSSKMDFDYWLRIRTKTKWKFYDRVISDFMVRKGAQSSGLIRKDENDINTITVLTRYLSPFEMKIFKFLDKYVYASYKILR